VGVVGGACGNAEINGIHVVQSSQRVRSRGSAVWVWGVCNRTSVQTRGCVWVRGARVVGVRGSVVVCVL